MEGTTWQLACSAVLKLFRRTRKQLKIRKTPRGTRSSEISPTSRLRHHDKKWHPPRIRHRQQNSVKCSVSNIADDANTTPQESRATYSHQIQARNQHLPSCNIQPPRRPNQSQEVQKDQHKRKQRTRLSVIKSRREHTTRGCRLIPHRRMHHLRGCLSRYKFCE